MHVMIAWRSYQDFDGFVIDMNNLVMNYFDILFRFTRLSVAPITINVLLVGAFATGQPLSWQTGVSIVLLGLTAHFFGFGLNNIIDLPVDSNNPHRADNPLVSGELSASLAHILVWIQPLLAVSLLLIAQPGKPILILVTLLSIVLSLVYNLWSKRGSMPPVVAELGLSGAIGCLLLVGALLQTQSLSIPIWLFFAAASIQMLLTNSVSSGLKDISTDQASGARSFVLWMGASSGQGHLTIPRRIKTYAYTLQVVVAGLTIYLVVSDYLYVSTLPKVMALSFVILLHSGAIWHLSYIFNANTFTELRSREPLLNAILNYTAVLISILMRSPVYFGISISLAIILAISRVIAAAKHTAHNTV